MGTNLGVSAYRRIGVSAYRRIGVSAYRRIGVSAYRRIGVSAYGYRTAHRAPRTAHRAPRTAHRSPLTAHRALRRRRNADLARLRPEPGPMVQRQTRLVLPLMHHLVQQRFQRLGPSMPAEMPIADRDLAARTGRRGRIV